MNRNVMITCALTGAGDTVGRSEHVPVTPEQIAESGIAAARAGATIVHVHVRDPETGQGLPRRRPLPRGRRADPRLATWTSSSTPPPAWAATWCSTRTTRRRSSRAPTSSAASTGSPTSRSCCPTSAPSTAAASTSARAAWSTSARRTCCARARSRSRSSASGARWRSSTPATCGSPSQLVEEGLIDAPPMFQLCMGIPYGAPADPLLLAAMVNQLPERRGVGVVRPRPDADAVGGAVGAARRPRPRRAGGQPLPEQGRQGDQRPARRARPDDRRGDGRARRRPRTRAARSSR